MSARIAMAAARGIVLSCDRSKLVEFGGHIELNRHWAHSLLKIMKFVQRKTTMAKSKNSVANFAELKKSFTRRADPELGSNWYQDGPELILDHGTTGSQASRNDGGQRQATNYCRVLWVAGGRLSTDPVDIQGKKPALPSTICFSTKLAH